MFKEDIKVGTRVIYTSWDKYNSDESRGVQPGDLGTVVAVGSNYAMVEWDRGPYGDQHLHSFEDLAPCEIDLNKLFEVGDKVMQISKKSHTTLPLWTPPVGTVGVVKEVCDCGTLKVQWPIGSTSHDDCWYIAWYKVKKVEENKMAKNLYAGCYVKYVGDMKDEVYPTYGQICHLLDICSDGTYLITWNNNYDNNCYVGKEDLEFNEDSTMSDDDIAFRDKRNHRWEEQKEFLLKMGRFALNDEEYAALEKKLNDGLNSPEINDEAKENETSTTNTDSRLSDQEIFDMLCPKFEKHDLDLHKIEDVVRAIAITYRSGYGRGEKGRPFKIGESGGRWVDIEPDENVPDGTRVRYRGGCPDDQEGGYFPAPMSEGIKDNGIWPKSDFWVDWDESFGTFFGRIRYNSSKIYFQKWLEG